MTLSAQDATEQRQKKHVRDRWLLSAPALILIIAASVGPLLIVVLYSFLAPGSYGDVKWEFSTEGWFNVLFTRDIFDDTVSLADAHFSIFWRSHQACLRHDGVTA
jgi:spermidine/putrescine transport system permease protein